MPRGVRLPGGTGRRARDSRVAGERFPGPDEARERRVKVFVHGRDN